MKSTGLSPHPAYGGNPVYIGSAIFTFRVSVLFRFPDSAAVQRRRRSFASSSGFDCCSSAFCFSSPPSTPWKPRRPRRRYFPRDIHYLHRRYPPNIKPPPPPSTKPASPAKLPKNSATSVGNSSTFQKIARDLRVSRLPDFHWAHSQVMAPFHDANHTHTG